MADLMMRMAGRGNDGLAKAISTLNDGSITVAPTNAILLNELFSTQGRNIAPGETWQSTTYETKDFNFVNFTTSVNKHTAHSITIEHLQRNGPNTNVIETVNYDGNPANKASNGSFALKQTHFRIKVKNNGSENLMLAMYMYMSSKNSASTIKNIYEESTSTVGRTINPNSFWESPVFDARDFDVLIYQTLVNVNALHSIELIEISEGFGRFEYNRLNLGAQLTTTTVRGSENITCKEFKIRITNHDVIPFKIGLNFTLAISKRYKKNRFTELIDMSQGGRISISPGQEWISPNLNANGCRRVAFFTSLPEAYKNYEISIVPVFRNLKIMSAKEVVSFAEELTGSSQGSFENYYNDIAFVITNNSSSDILISLSANGIQ